MFQTSLCQCDYVHTIRVAKLYRLILGLSLQRYSPLVEGLIVREHDIALLLHIKSF
jgi:hypothetical protein